MVYIYYQKLPTPISQVPSYTRKKERKKEIKHPVYVQNALEFAENAYDDIQWGKDAKQIVKDLSNKV